jgi:hypothetical protein
MVRCTSRPEDIAAAIEPVARQGQSVWVIWLVRKTGLDILLEINHGSNQIVPYLSPLYALEQLENHGDIGGCYHLSKKARTISKASSDLVRPRYIGIWMLCRCALLLYLLSMQSSNNTFTSRLKLSLPLQALFGFGAWSA